MAFVNEFVSAEDIEKYHLDSLYLRWNPFHKSVPPSHRHMWTVDREREAFLMVLAFGTEGYPRRTSGVLFWRGIEWQVAFDRDDESSEQLTDVPFKRVWKLGRIQHPQGKDVPLNELLPIVKEALVVHGFRGAAAQVPNTVVEFKF